MAATLVAFFALFFAFTAWCARLVEPGGAA